MLTQVKGVSMIILPYSLKVTENFKLKSSEADWLENLLLKLGNLWFKTQNINKQKHLKYFETGFI